jgi:16S rRNA G966 N2-methylase RsmD
MTKRKTTEIFIQEAKDIFTPILDSFELIQYVNNKTKVTFICLRHEEKYDILPSSYLNGHRCPTCGNENRSKSQRDTYEIFVEKARLVHGQLYDYLDKNYVNNKTDIHIYCKKHEYTFIQRPDNHLEGQGCIKCSKEPKIVFIDENSNTDSDDVISKDLSDNFIVMNEEDLEPYNLKNKTFRDKFIFDAKNKYGDTYIYSSVQYINNRENVDIECKIHGIFKQTPSNHLNKCTFPGIKCPKCSKELQLKNQSEKNGKKFIEKAIKIHNGEYTYEKVDYKNDRTDVIINCLKHGYFKQTPGNHNRSKNPCGCQKCAILRMINKPSKRKLTNEQYIERSIKIHNNKMDYSKVEYNGMLNTVNIICKIHGEFTVKAFRHLLLVHGGCNLCYMNSITYTADEFIKKAIEVHGQNTYEYTGLTYINMRQRVTIICKKHGEFDQFAYNYLTGSGCPSCSSYKSESLCRDIIEEITGYKFPKRRPSVLKQSNGWNLELDGYCEELKLGFEYNGIIHYQECKFISDSFEDIKKRDNLKKELCKKAGICLIIVPYWYDYKTPKDMRKFLLNIINDYISIQCPVIVKNDLEQYLSHTEINLPSYFNEYVKIPEKIFKILKNNISASVDSIMLLLQKYKNPLISVSGNIDKLCRNLKDLDGAILNDKITSSTTGSRVLNNFMMPVMIKARRKNKINYIDAWNDLIERRKLVERMLQYDKCMNNGSLYGCYGCIHGRVYNFPINVAKAVYNHFNAIRVLDPCAGYGGRLAGFWLSNAQEYVGIDPNDNPYDELAACLSENINEKKNYEIIKACAEDVDEESLGQFDMIFTSPPYYDTEIYSENLNQSCHRYKTLSEWLNKFLFKVIHKYTWNLCSDGILAINIKDSNKYNIICPMISYIKSLELYTELIPITIIKPKRHKQNYGKEMIYIFKKN